MLVIEPARDFAEARALIEEYGRSTGVDLEFQGFSHEIEQLETYYAAVFVARWSGDAAGCVALRTIDRAICEMKRLYVRPSCRGHGIGPALAGRVIDEARRRGHTVMRLDTLPSMTAAMALYERLGFTDIEPYRFSPIPGTRFLELKL